MNKKRILVLFGGRSAEHEISVSSALSVIKSFNQEKYEILPVAVSKEGKFLDFCSSRNLLSTTTKPKSKELEAYRRFLEAGKTDVFFGKNTIVFPMLHGPYGEDGTIQGMLEILDLPYVGSGVLGSALGMDKIMQKKVFSFEKLPILPWLGIFQKEWQQDQKLLLNKIKKEFHFPLFIKPSGLGSSIGITKAHNSKELLEGVKTAFSYGGKILIEQGIFAREIECSVLGNDKPRASLPGEIIPKRNFYDYEAKYFDKKTKLIIPAKLSSVIIEKIQTLSLKAFKALDCSGMARVDFLLDKKENNKIYLNEINTIPGFTKISMYTKLWEVSGLSYGQLLDTLISLAEERYQKKKKGEEGAFNIMRRRQ